VTGSNSSVQVNVVQSLDFDGNLSVSRFFGKPNYERQA